MGGRSTFGISVSTVSHCKYIVTVHMSFICVALFDLIRTFLVVVFLPLIVVTVVVLVVEE